MATYDAIKTVGLLTNEKISNLKYQYSISYMSYREREREHEIQIFQQTLQYNLCLGRLICEQKFCLDFGFLLRVIFISAYLCIAFSPPRVLFNVKKVGQETLWRIYAIYYMAGYIVVWILKKQCKKFSKYIIHSNNLKSCQISLHL